MDMAVDAPKLTKNQRNSENGIGWSLSLCALDLDLVSSPNSSSQFPQEYFLSTCSVPGSMLGSGDLEKSTTPVD